MDRRQAYMVFVFLLSYILSYIDRQILSLVLQPVKASLQLSDTEIGAVLGLFFGWFAIIAVFPVAVLADRMNRIKLVAGCICLWSLATAATGLATEFWHLAVARAVTAIAETGLIPIALSIFADSFGRTKVAVASAAIMTGAYIGPALALVGGGLLLDWFSTHQAEFPYFGAMEPWRLVFIVLGAPGLALALLVICTLQEPQRRFSTEENEEADATLSQFLWRHRAVVMPFLGATVMVIAFQSCLQAWLPTLIHRLFKQDIAEVGFRMGMVYVSFGLAGAAFSAWITRKSNRAAQVGWLLKLFTVSSFMLVLPALVIGIAPHEWVVFLLFGISLFFIAVMVSIISIPLLLMSPSYIRTRVIAVQAASTSLLGFPSPILVGFMNESVFHDEQRINWSVSIICGLAAILATILFRIARGAADQFFSESEVSCGIHKIQPGSLASRASTNRPGIRKDAHAAR